MKTTNIVCDYCGTPSDGNRLVVGEVHVTIDKPLVENDRAYPETIDLCCHCLARELTVRLHDKPVDYRRQWVKNIRKYNP